MKSISASLLLFMFASVSLSSVAHSAGFEKSVMWSGREAGYAAATVGRIEGSQSLYFNPAGLAGAQDASLNFSPTWIKLDGNLVSLNKREETDDNFIPSGGLTVNYLVTEQLGFGVGAYAVGGSKAVYNSVDVTGETPTVTFRPDLFTDLELVEYSIGAAYQVSPGFRVGASWRIVEADGSFSVLKRTTLAYTYLSVKDAKETRYNGFRIGVQYEAPESAWGVGASFRNSIDFNAQGSGTGSSITVIPTNSTTAATVGTVGVGLTFPLAASLGGHYALSDTFRILSGVDFVQYSKNKEIKITGTLNGTTLPNIPLNWEDMWNFRIGGEYTGLNIARIRAGYSLTTRVTSKTDAKATLPPAGTGHLFTFGGGATLFPNFDLDAAFEYAFNNGAGSMSATPVGSTSRELLAGVETQTKARTTAIHTGVTYRF